MRHRDPAEAGQFAVESDRVFGWTYNQTNAYREGNGLHRLIISPTIANVAQEYADFLAANNALGHEADGRTPPQRLDAHGIKYCGWAENVYEYRSEPSPAPWQTAASEAMQGWKQSTDHNANLLSSTMTTIGVGTTGWTYDDGRNYYKIVQLFIDDCGGTAPRVKRLGKKKL